MKFGFDYHGVADTHQDVYGAITRALLDAGHEVHIITGYQPNFGVTTDLTASGIVWTHWFSIVQYHIDLGEYPVEFRDGKPWLDGEVWDREKAEYCEREGIAMLIDNSPSYGANFKGDCLFLLQKDQKSQHAWDILGKR